MHSSQHGIKKLVVALKSLSTWNCYSALFTFGNNKTVPVRFNQSRMFIKPGNRVGILGDSSSIPSYCRTLEFQSCFKRRYSGNSADSMLTEVKSSESNKSAVRIDVGKKNKEIPIIHPLPCINCSITVNTEAKKRVQKRSSYCPVVQSNCQSSHRQIHKNCSDTVTKGHWRCKQ